MKRAGIILFGVGVTLFLSIYSPMFFDTIGVYLFLPSAVIITAGILLIMYSPKKADPGPAPQQVPDPQPVAPLPPSVALAVNSKMADPDPVSHQQPTDPQPVEPQPSAVAPAVISDPVPHNPMDDIVILEKPNPNCTYSADDHAEILGMRDFCVLDVETTGLNCRIHRIVQIGIIKVVNNVAVDRLDTLVNPEMEIPASATKIHGITNDDVISAPTYDEIADRVYSLLNNSTVVGHNVTFDLNFIQFLLIRRSDPDSALTLDYIDTWAYSHQVLPSMPNYKLQTLLQFYGIDPGKAHTAYADAAATLELFNHLRYEYTHKEELEKQRAEMAKAEKKRQREEADAERRRVFSPSPLFNKRVCFTGSFSLDREAMEKLALSVGALIQEKNPTRNTAYLVKGDVSELPEWAIERKLGKAEALVAAGKPVEIINESEYLSLIAQAKAALAAASEVRTS